MQATEHMSEEQLVRLAESSFPEDEITNTLDACEAFYMNGCPDESNGDVESPEGFFYRVDRWLVAVDSQGFKYLDEYPSVPDAQREFEQREERNAHWYDEDDEA